MSQYKKLRNGSWGIRGEGPAPAEGDVVVVTKRSGEAKEEVVSHVLWAGEDRRGVAAWIATLKRSRSTVRRRTFDEYDSLCDAQARESFARGVLRRRQLTAGRTAPIVLGDRRGGLPFNAAQETSMYTIKLHGDSVQALALVRALRERLVQSQFSADIRSPHLHETRRPKAGWIVELHPIRLRELKLYCGQHPGECELGARRRSRCLEWDDWVEFNGLVNDVLDAEKALACVWSVPPELLSQGKKFWIRRGEEGRRVRYDWVESPGPHGRVRRVWNAGTSDQFQAAQQAAE